MTIRFLPYTLIIAHRGNSGPAPENTRVAIEQAIELEVDLVEVDVSLSRDGVPVLIHGPRLERTTNGKGKVGQMTFDQLKALDAGSWKGAQFAGEPILSLREGLEHIRDRIIVNLDIKTPKATMPVLELVRVMKMRDQVVITGCTRPCVKTVRRIAPQLPVLLNLDRWLNHLAYIGPKPAFRSCCVALARSAGADGINISHHFVDPELVEAAHRQGLSLWTWTVDEQERVEALVGQGVDSISTNWPARMLQHLGRHRPGLNHTPPAEGA